METVLAFIFALQLGIVPSNTQIDFISQDSFHGFTELEAGFVICDIITIKASAKTFIELGQSGYSFYPHQIDFFFDVNIKITDNILIGFRHTCFHPIYIGNNLNSGHLDRNEEIYIKLQGKINLF